MDPREMTSPPVTICPPRYAQGYARIDLDDFNNVIPHGPAAMQNYKHEPEALRGFIPYRK